jgi:hypothetical protein
MGFLRIDCTDFDLVRSALRLQAKPANETFIIA